MNNLYWGVTNTIAGGTYFWSKALLSIDEGFRYGSTTEYVHLGNFEIEDFQNNGGFNQTLNLSATEPLNRLKYNNSFFTRTFTNAQIFFDGFISPDTLSSNFLQSSGSWGVTNSNLVTYPSTGGVNVIYTNGHAMSDYRITTQFQVTVNNAFQPQLYLHYQDSNNLMAIVIDSGTMKLQKVFNGAFTALQTAGTGISIDINTNYWFRAVVKNNRFMGFFANSDGNFTKYIDYVDSSIPNGLVGLGAYSNGVTNKFSFDYLDLVEIGNQYTTENLLRGCLAMGGIFGCTFQSDFQGFGNFTASNGSSWVLGTSNNVFLQNTGSGSSFHYFLLNGSSLSDFVCEFELRSGTSNYFGTLVGTTQSYIMNYLRYVSASNFDNTIRVDFNTGLSTFFYIRNGEYFTVQPDTWYQAKIIKSGLFIGWYINDQMINSAYGTSLVNSSLVTIGLLGYAGSVAGSTTEFRNFRISSFDNLVKDLTVQPNDNIYSLYQRVLPDGAIAVYTNNGYEFFKLGASRGTHTFGLSDYFTDSSDIISNISGYDLAITKGQNNITGLVGSNNHRKVTQLDSARVMLNNDQNVQNFSDATAISLIQLLSNNQGMENVTVSSLGRPSMQMADQINYVDNYLGLSYNYRVNNFVRILDMQSGEYSQDTTFTFDQNDL